MKNRGSLRFADRIPTFVTGFIVLVGMAVFLVAAGIAAWIALASIFSR